MDRSANVSSIEAVRALRVALAKFETNSRDVLTLLEMEVRRAVVWIEQDRRRYWPSQVKQAQEALVEARNELERCELRYGSEAGPSCYQQKKHFERAKRRLRYCEEQVRAVKKWTRVVRQEMIEFESQKAQMAQCLDADMPRAITALGRMIGALEKYAGDRRSVDAGALGVATGQDEEASPAASGTSNADPVAEPEA
jgi:hypothetical protein